MKIILYVLFVSCAASVTAQNSAELDRADSLFHQNRYTQSFEIYKSIFDQGKYTPTMLLKMAFVQEGLNRTAPALYYLSLYYDATLDESVATKIEELADKHRLTGYKFGEADRIHLLYNKNKSTITIALNAFIAFLVVIMVYIRRNGSRPVGTFVCLILVMVVTLAHINHFGQSRTAIIANSNTYIMDGPSAGASVIGVAEEGHKVIVANKEDVWVRVKWNGKNAYIKERNLLPLNL